MTPAEQIALATVFRLARQTRARPAEIALAHVAMERLGILPAPRTDGYL